MSGAFDAWLLIVGLVVGAGLTWLVLADSNRREVDILEDELPSEAAWISETMTEDGVPLDQPTAERVLRLHRTYLASLPPDDPLADAELAEQFEAWPPPAAPAGPTAADVDVESGPASAGGRAVDTAPVPAEVADGALLDPGDPDGAPGEEGREITPSTPPVDAAADGASRPATRAAAEALSEESARPGPLRAPRHDAPGHAPDALP